MPLVHGHCWSGTLVPTSARQNLSLSITSLATCTVLAPHGSFEIFRQTPPRFATTMAAPATKRRKLDHEVASASDADDFSEDEPAGTDEEESTSDANSDLGPTMTRAGNAKEQRPKAATAIRATERSRRDGRLQDGVYTAETFKSNIFKLQVDALLDQVRVKYGKKEAPAEHAMRALKTLMEQLPAREPLVVGSVSRE